MVEDVISSTTRHRWHDWSYNHQPLCRDVGDERHAVPYTLRADVSSVIRRGPYTGRDPNFEHHRDAM